MGAFIKVSGTTAPARWPGPVIPYVLRPALTTQMVEAITQAIAVWESETNIRFVRRDNEADYIEFQTGQDACLSPVGRIGGSQAISLRLNCGTKEVIHEIGHAIGMIHEHQRPDRDAFVSVIIGNVQPGKSNNFVVESASGVITCQPYDLRSIMHYSPITFSADGMAPTLVSKVVGATMDSSTTLTALDVQCINSIYPSLGVVRRSDSGPGGAGEVKQIAVARDNLTASIVTAVVTKNNNLALIQWQIDVVGGILRVNDSGDQSGTASDISIAKGNFYVTAVRSGSGNLLLISWNVGLNKIERVNDSGSLAGEATLIRIVSLSLTTFLTACRDGNGNLLLMTWQVNADGSFRRLDTKGAGGVSEISLIRLRKDGPDELVTSTVEAADGSVLSIVWAVSPGGGLTRRGNSGSQMGKGSQISSAWSNNQLVVSCKSEIGKLLLISFSISGDGFQLKRLSDSGDNAGEISENAMIARPYGVLSAVRSATGNLVLIKWQQSSNGAIRRLGDNGNQAGTASDITLGHEGTFGAGSAPIVTCVRDGSGNLLLISWDDLSISGEV
jgi:Astacin (Peptidase family M12A)